MLARMSAEAPIRPRSHHATNEAVLALALDGGHAGRTFVDIGSGEGYFPDLLARRLEALGGTASDIFLQHFRCTCCSVSS